MVEPVDEAWELWLCERGRRLTLGGTVPIDDAIAAWREGKDPVLLMVEGIRRRVASGELDLGDELAQRGRAQHARQRGAKAAS